MEMQTLLQRGIIVAASKLPLLEFESREFPMTYPQRACMAFCFLCLVFLAVPAYAYADPNTVGLISQVLTPLLIMAGACVTFLRKSLLAAFDRMRRRMRGRAEV